MLTVSAGFKYSVHCSCFLNLIFLCLSVFPGAIYIARAVMMHSAGIDAILMVTVHM